MNFRNILKAGAFCLSALGMFNSVSAMNENPSEEEDYPEWPAMAVDGTPEHPEGEHLAHYHATAEKRGFYFYLPKDAYELDCLYRLCSESGQIQEEGMADLWRAVLLNVCEEVIARCLDGDTFFIDKYTDYLVEFIALTASHLDTTFVKFLYERLPVERNLEKSLWYSAADVASYINAEEEEYSKYTLDSTHILNFVKRIDIALTVAGKNTCDFF